MKTALITGTSSGIGLELIKKFDKKGIRTISLSRSDIVSDYEFSSNLKHINFINLIQTLFYQSLGEMR